MVVGDLECVVVVLDCLGIRGVVGSEVGEPRAIGAPGKFLDPVGGLGYADRVAAVHGHDEDLRVQAVRGRVARVLAALLADRVIGDECQARPVRRSLG
jgi:hypothetical protein